MSVDLNYSVTFWLYGPHPAIHIYARYTMQEGASEKELQPFQPLLPCLTMLTVQLRNHWKPLLCLITLLICLRRSFDNKAEAKGKSRATDPLDTFRGSAIEEGAQPDHSASEHASTLIASVILFMMLKAKHSLTYLVGWRPLCHIVSEDLRVFLQTFKDELSCQPGKR